MTLNDKRVFVGSFTFGNKSKKYPYKMFRDISIKKAIQELSVWLKYHKDTLILTNTIVDMMKDIFGKDLVEAGE